MPSNLRESDVTRIVKSEELPRRFRQRIKNDPVIKRLQERYSAAIQKRVKWLQEDEAKKLAKEVRREFVANLAKAGVPMMPQETYRFTTKQESNEAVQTVRSDDLPR